MTYNYKCNDCNEIITISCKLKDYSSEIVCPHCGKFIQRDYENSNIIYNTYFNGSYNNGK